MIDPPEWVCSYAAGYIDGEGCLMLRPSLDKSLRNPHKRWAPIVTVSCLDIEPLNFLITNFGGWIVKHKRYTSVGNTVHTWSISGIDNVSRLLTLIYPYLIIKKGQADILLELINDRPVLVNDGIGYPPSEWDRQQRLVDLLKVTKRMHTKINQ